MPKGTVTGPPNPLPIVGSVWKMLRSEGQKIVVVDRIEFDDRRREHRVFYHYKEGITGNGKGKGSAWYESGFRRPASYTPMLPPIPEPEIGGTTPSLPHSIDLKLDMGPITKALERLGQDVADLKSEVEKERVILEKLLKAWSPEA